MLDSREAIDEFVDNIRFETGEVHRATFPCLEGCEEQGDQVAIVCLDDNEVAIRKEQYTLDHDWNIIRADDLEDVLAEMLEQTLHELEEIKLQE